MGKLSIEEKAKAYDEALKRAIKHRNNDGLTLEQYETIDIIFPELKESEDEKIRKELIEFVKSRGGFKQEYIAWIEKKGEKIEPIEGFNTEFERQISHLIASAINREHEYNEGYVKWTSNALLNFAKRELEKQGEQKPIKEHNVCDFCEERYGCVNPCPMKLIEKQKPTDKAETKFKVGDWIIHKDNKHIPIKIIEKIGMYYGAVDTVNYYHNICIDYINENYRLWTIQDAKDGDVLATSAGAFIYNGNNGGGSCPGCYCGINTLGNFKSGVKHHWTGKTVFPATKEQRGILFKKMREAGYEWDEAKKELKKIEQKPTAWSEEDKNRLNHIIKLIDYNLKDGDYCYGHEGRDYLSKNEIVKWLKDLKNRVHPQQEWKQENVGDLTDFENVMMHIGESFFGRHAGLDPNDINTIKEQANLLLELVPSKEWNEEDDYNLQCMIAKVTSDIQKGNIGRNNELIDWLKYLKYRVQHQNRISY